MVRSTAALVVLTLLCLWVLRSRPAKYHGKNAAEWFREFSRARAKYQVTVSLPTGQVFHSFDELSLAGDPAATALRALGTNSGTYLKRRIERSVSRLNQLYEKAFFKLPRPVAMRLPGPLSAEDDATASALVLLRADAAPAIPAVIHAISKGTSFQRTIYLNALRQLRYRPEDVDAALASLTAANNTGEALKVVTVLHVHTETAARVVLQGISGTNATLAATAWRAAADFGHHASLFLLSFTSALADGDTEVRLKALWAVQQFGPNASPALPALVQSLQDTNEEIRYESARAIEALGTNALPALTNLYASTNDPSVMVQRCSARVISNLTFLAENHIRRQ